MNNEKSSAHFDNELLVGTEGWTCPCWNDSFFPPDLPEEWRFDYYCIQFRSTQLPATVWHNADAAQTIEMLDANSDDQFRFIVEIPKQPNPACLCALQRLSPKIAAVIYSHLDQTIVSRHFPDIQPAQIWLADEQPMPTQSTNFLLASVCQPGLRRIRRVIEEIVGWKAESNRQAALIFQPSANATTLAEQARILAELLQA